MIQTLLDGDAELLSVNTAKNTAIHIACLNGNHSILEYLLTQLEDETELTELRNAQLQV